MDDKFNDAPAKGGRITYAASDPTLSGDMPDSFNKAPPVRTHFNESGDPLYKAANDAMSQTERERREQSGVPDMVKLHKPFPELKPDHEHAQGVTRAGFNNDWLKEQRRVRLAEFAHERELYEEREREKMESNIYYDNMHGYTGRSR